MKAQIQQAEALLKQGELDEALNALENVLAVQPGHPRASFVAACALIAQGRPDRAIRHLANCEDAALSAPNPVNACRNLAQQYINAGSMGEAQSLLRRALDTSPDAAELEVKLADVLMRLGRFDEAGDLYRSVVERHRDAAPVWSALGAAEQHAGNTVAAIEAYETSLKINGAQNDVYNNMMAALLELGRAEDALAYCRRWLGTAPENIDALAFMTLLTKETGRDSDAAPLLDFDRLVHAHAVTPPESFGDLNGFNRALEAHVLAHPNLVTPPEDHPTWHHRALRIASRINSGDCGPVKALEQVIHVAITDYFDSTGPAAGHPFLVHRPDNYRIEAWAAVLEGEGNQQPHIHMDGYLSGCYYVTIPDEISAADNGRDGTIKGGFEVGRPPSELNIRSDFPTRVIKPYEGLMVLFPAYLYHGTVPFKSSQRRICIAFDVVPDKAAA